MASNLPYSEQVRLAGLEWADLDAAARLLEEGKSAYLSQRMAALGDTPVTKAERDVKASPDWSDYIKKMCAARTRANKARIEWKFLEAQAWEHRDEEATKRAEMRMT